MQRSFFIRPALPRKKLRDLYRHVYNLSVLKSNYTALLMQYSRCLCRATSSEADGVPSPPLLDNRERGVRRPRDPLVSNLPHSLAFAPVWSNSPPNEIPSSQLPLVALQSRLLS